MTDILTTEIWLDYNLNCSHSAENDLFHDLKIDWKTTYLGSEHGWQNLSFTEF